jgi:hypothetical protein
LCGGDEVIRREVTLMKPKVKNVLSGGKGTLKPGGKAPINEKAAPKTMDKRVK